MPSAIVVGGGLSGLSAAHTLIEGGVHVTLLERNAFLGKNTEVLFYTLPPISLPPFPL